MNKLSGKKSITINDIAKELSVSKSTVSRALQDHHSIGDATKKAVRELVKKYNYHPNTIASSLFNKSTKTIGVIIPILSHYFFSTAIAGIEEVAYKAGYKVIICQSNESYQKEVDLVKTLLSAQVDGLIVSVSMETKNLDHFNLFINKGIPLIFFDRIPDGIESDTVSGDNYSGAYGIVKHFIEQGYKRIAHFAGPLNIIVAATRLQGYKDALRDHGIPFDPSLVYEVGFERKHGIEAAEKLIAGGDLPEAIFCVSDPVAIGLMLTLKKYGIAIPNDVAVAGFNDDPTATVIDPPLTTVIQPAFEMGASAADIFLSKKSKTSTDKIFDKRVHATTLLIRGSSVKTC